MAETPAPPLRERERARRPGRLVALRARLSATLERLFEVRWIWSVLFLVGLSPWVLAPRIGPSLPIPEAGAVVSREIQAPATVEFVDRIATHDVQEAARAAVPPVYDRNGALLDESSTTVERLFEDGARALAAPQSKRGSAASPEAIARRLRADGELRVPQSSLEFLAAARFEARIETRLLRAIVSVFAHDIAGARASWPRSGRVILRDPSTGRERTVDRLEEILSVDEARRAAVDVLAKAGAGPAEREALGPLLDVLIGPNLLMNGPLTEARRQEAVARIEPLIVRIPRGKVILEAGEVVGDDAVRTLRAFNDARGKDGAARPMLASLLFIGLLLFFISRYVFFYQKSYKNERHLFALMVVVIVLSLYLDQGFVWLYEHVVDTLRVESYANPAFYRAMMPVAAGAMLITLLANARVGMAYALFHLPLFGMMMEWDLPLVLFSLISNLAAIYGITATHQRTSLIKAGLAVGSVNAVAVLGLLSATGRAVPVSHVLLQMSCGLLGGILVAVLVSFLLPILESLFNILTDIRLLELSNLNNPLLRRLAVEAPGSYNHSVIVGTLAEAAAEAIGANALFCRVAAYYHDVGKMLKPDYFIENQRTGDNRHDTLSPHMSALVIASHVKEGYELARSYGLPRQVLDIIPQHHGTRKINFFFQKAKRNERHDVEEVRESDYRYPGPKPQNREAAIFMLSDSIEAAARTLEDPSPARFKGLIRKIISDVVLDDQFDQCDLTFADLEKVSAAFLRTLSSIYHHRIDYPGFDFDKIPERTFRGSRTHEDVPPRFKGWGR